MTKKQTHKLFKVLLIVASLGSLYFVPWLLVKAWILPLPSTVQEQLDEAVDHGFGGMIVYVDQKGKSPAFYGAGWHDPQKKIPATPRALFKIASISKLYHAVAIAKLVDADSLSLDKTLGDYFPELAGRIEYADEITLRMMVQHRSGIPNYTDAPDYWANPSKNTEEALDLILDSPAYFKPGEDYGYSNTNYLLIGELIEKTVGYSRHQYIKETILDRLGLSNTFSSINEVNLNDVMSGYHIGYPHDLKTDDIGMVATAEDVGIFLRALNDGTLFDGSEQESYASIYENEHSGWVPGYQSFANYYEDMDAVVIQFYANTDRELIMWNLAEIINKRIKKILGRNQSSN